MMKDNKFSLDIDGMDFAGPITKSLFDLESTGIFKEDPLCSCTMWVQNVDDKILEIVVQLMDADTQILTTELGERMDDFAVFLFSIENIKHQSDVPLTEKAIEESAQKFMFSCMLEQMRREGTVRAINSDLPIHMVKYEKVT